MTTDQERYEIAITNALNRVRQDEQEAFERCDHPYTIPLSLRIALFQCMPCKALRYGEVWYPHSTLYT